MVGDFAGRFNSSNRLRAPAGTRSSASSLARSTSSIRATIRAKNSSFTSVLIAEAISSSVV